jgi:Flp pilus assembly protein TadG
VETAIVLSAFLLLVFTCIEFGRMNIIRHSVDNAAYEAARRGIVPGATATDVEAEARAIMGFVGARGVDVTVTPAVLDPSVTDIHVLVEVAADQNGYLAPKFFAGKTLAGECTMSREQL